jgi:putative ABC transport system permease protein
MSMLQDFRFAIRVLAARPGATAVMILALTLGIGASVTVYSAVSAAYYRPVPYERPERIVYLWESNPSLGWQRGIVSLKNFEDWRARTRVLEDASVYSLANANLTGGPAAAGEPLRLSAVRAAPNLLGVLGVSPFAGRGFRADEAEPGSDRVALLGHRLWRERFGGDPGVVGATIALDGEPVTVVGVLPAGLRLLGDEADVWVPLRPNAAQLERGTHSAFAVGRLAPSTSLDQARADFDAVAALLAEEYPDTNEGFGVTVEPLADILVDEQTRLACLSLSIAAGLVLAIACANVGNFLLAGTATRRREMAIRAALGAGRARIVRQLLSESALLALAGGALGLVTAVWAVDLVNAFAALGDLPVAVDGRVVAFAAAISTVTALGFGLAPAIHGSASFPGELLKEGGGAAALARRGRRLLNAFMVWEVALALVLLVGAGLMLQSFLRLRQTDPGFDARSALVTRVELPESSEPHQIAAFSRGALEAVRSIPGVIAAGTVDTPPMTSGRSGRSFAVEGRPVENAEQTYADVLTVSDGYFRALGARVLEGAELDGRGAPAIVVNETMARRYWPGESAVGRRIAFSTFADSGAGEPEWLAVAGVVRDVKAGSLASDPRPEVYVPAELNPVRTITFVVRTERDPLAVASAVRKQIWALDGALPVFGTTTLERIVAESVAGYRLFTTLLVAFATVAFVLATIGVASVAAHSVSLRTHEIGVRRALGAGTWDVLRLVVGGEVKLVLAGLAIGYAAAFGLAQLLASLLYSVTPADPLTYAGVTLALAAVALAACYVPARRALRVDPAIALRRG